MIFSDKNIVAFEFEILDSTGECQAIKHQGTHAYISLAGGSIRYRLDGGEPKPTEGHILSDRQSIELANLRNIENFKFIQASNVPSILTITYGRL
jgi:hypothetical protein